MVFRQNRRRFIDRRLTPQRRNIQSSRNSKITNSVTPFRVSAKKQMVSVPNHNYQLKVRKVFRIFCATPSANSQVFTTTDVLDAIRNELGIAASTTGGELVGIHDIRVYYTVVSLSTAALANVANTLTVALFDIEETSGSGNSNYSSLYEDIASPAGVCHVRAVYPVNNRPTFSRTTTASNFALVGSSTLGILVLDVDATYTRTPSVTN